MLKTLFLSTLFGVFTLLYFHLTGPITSTPIKTLSNTSWSSPYADWHARALLTPHPSPHNFTPTYDSLLLVSLVNPPFVPQRVALTLYSQSPSNTTIPNDIIAIDALGRVLLVSPEDGAGIMTLARKSLEVSPINARSNIWFVKPVTTCPTLDFLWILPPNHVRNFGRHLRSVSVYGFSKWRKELETPQNGVYGLPDALWELMGLVDEAGVGDYEERDEVVLMKVREAVEGLWW
jgi:hypothetical protein